MTWDVLHRWWMPFLWLAASSLIAVPVAIYLQLDMQLQTGAELGLPYGEHWVLRDHFLETILIYVLNLGCAIWLLDADGSTRWAAFWALLLAIARIATPITLVALADVQMATGQHYVDWATMRIVVWFADVELFIFGLMLWAVFARFVGETGGAAVGHGAHAEAY